MKNKILVLIFFIISNFYSQSQTIDSGGFKQNIINNTDNNFTYLGFNFGLTKPLGDFGDLNINNPNAGIANNGIGISLLNFGATWKGKYGFHFALFANKNIMKNGVSHQAWNFVGIMIGPSYTIYLNMLI